MCFINYKVPFKCFGLFRKELKQKEKKTFFIKKKTNQGISGYQLHTQEAKFQTP
jgi:hypothetical protein